MTDGFLVAGWVVLILGFVLYALSNLTDDDDWWGGPHD